MQAGSRDVVPLHWEQPLGWLGKLAPQHCQEPAPKVLSPPMAGGCCGVGSISRGAGAAELGAAVSPGMLCERRAGKPWEGGRVLGQPWEV